jgi:hypothetical protein
LAPALQGAIAEDSLTLAEGEYIADFLARCGLAGFGLLDGPFPSFALPLWV